MYLVDRFRAHNIESQHSNKPKLFFSTLCFTTLSVLFSDQEESGFFCSRFVNDNSRSPVFEPQSEHTETYRQYQQNKQNWPQKLSKRKKIRRSSSASSSDSDSDPGIRDPQVEYLASQKHLLRLQNYQAKMAPRKNQKKSQKKKAAGSGKGLPREGHWRFPNRRHQETQDRGTGTCSF